MIYSTDRDKFQYRNETKRIAILWNKNGASTSAFVLTSLCCVPLCYTTSVNAGCESPNTMQTCRHLSIYCIKWCIKDNSGVLAFL